MNITIREYKVKERIKFYIEYTTDGTRQRLTIPNLFLYTSKNIQNSTHNKEVKIELAKLTIELQRELTQGNNPLEYLKKRTANLHLKVSQEYLLKYHVDKYIESYTKKDKRNIQGVFKLFFNHLIESYDINLEKFTIYKVQLTHIQSFAKLLSENSKGEGAESYWRRFKKVIKYFIEEELIKLNLIHFNRIKVIKGKSEEKELLTLEEIKKIYELENCVHNTRDAFVFACLTGLRFVDVKNLKPSNFENKTIKLIQSKTNQSITIPLNNTTQVIFEKYKGSQNLFNLPSSTAVNKQLSLILKRIRINKHITFHCARHSFAVNLLKQNVPIDKIALLLGHTSMKHTIRYVKLLSDDKKDILENLNLSY